ncbi:MAG: radical SAM/SPASM family putative metalloenzyme maturase [Pedobacter sp.]
MRPQPSFQLTDALPAPFMDHPSKLFVEITTFCNLRCPMCVKQAADSNIIDGDMTEETFSALEPVFPQLEALLLNGIGESLMHPHLLDFIHRARHAMPEKSWIGFQSNGLLLDERWARDLVASGLDRLCLSVDGIKPDTFSKVREGEALSDMEKAFDFLAASRKRQPDTRLKIGVEFVLMQENKQQLLATLRWAADRGADFMLVTQASAYNSSAIAQLAYDNSTEQAIKIFADWRDKIADMGLDVRNYNPCWEMDRFYNEPESETARILEMVDKMRAEARRKDVFLDLPRLLQRSADHSTEMLALFTEAERLAEKLGIELNLPLAVPHSERKCDFVEDGGAFISWNGDVHPCYFLWHQFRCFINDWDRLIKPKIFGNINEGPLLNIWNDETFRTFRENVHAFDYPYCSNCTIAPCDLLQEEDFERDCYAKAEPCGACQWAMGLLQCLH